MADARGNDCAAGEMASLKNQFLDAVRDGDLSTFERLLRDVRVDPTVDDNEAIAVASENGHIVIVERLGLGLVRRWADEHALSLRCRRRVASSSAVGSRRVAVTRA